MRSNQSIRRPHIRRRRGATMAEVTIGTGISAIALFAGVGLFLTGMSSWIKGEANIEASTSSLKVVRLVSDELRHAMQITVNSTGTRVDYVRPRREADGSFTNPMVADGVARSIERDGTRLLMRTDGTTRVLARDILARKPAALLDYRVFTAPPGSVSRSLTVEVMAGKPGFRGETIVEASREVVYLRNVPQLSR